MSLDTSKVSLSFWDLVVENVGAGPALNVCISVDPPFRRAVETPGQELANARLFQEPIPMLPPGYRLSSFFDSAIQRYEAKDETLPQSHEVTISYDDGRGNEWREQTTLDTTIQDGLLFSEEIGVHQIGKSLQVIEKFFKASKPFDAPIHVATEDRDAYVGRIRARREEQRAQYEKVTAAVDEARQREAEAAAEGE